MTTATPRWSKSSYSDNGGNCLEWAPEHARRTGEVLVRDSKTPDGPVLTLTPQSFAHLVSFAKTHG